MTAPAPLHTVTRSAGPLVILVGGQARMVAAVAHSLGRRGIPVIQAINGDDQAVVRSRHLLSFVMLPSLLAAPHRFATALREVAERWPGALWLPLNDSALLGLAAAHDSLDSVARIGCPSGAVVAETLDKSRTARLAVEVGLEVPRSFSLGSADDLVARKNELKFPLFAKLRDKLDPERTRGVADFGVELFPDISTLQAAFVERPRLGSDYFFQEFCPGHDVLLSVLMHDGRAVTAFQSRSLRTWPSTGGVTVLTRSEPVDAEICARVVSLLRRIGWEGIAQADLRRNPATGRTVLLEINGRIWGSVSAAIQAGIDFPYYIWQLAHGETPRPPRMYQSGALSHWAMGDLKRLVRLWRRPAPGESRVMELLRFAWAFRPGVRGMIWHRDDPRPAWMEWKENVHRYVQAGAHGVRRAVFGAARVSP